MDPSDHSLISVKYRSLGRIYGSQTCYGRVNETGIYLLAVLYICLVYITNTMM